MLETFVNLKTKGMPVSSLELSYGDVRVYPGDTLGCLGIEKRGTNHYHQKSEDVASSFDISNTKTRMLTQSADTS
jgi:hypothetical protein